MSSEGLGVGTGLVVFSVLMRAAFSPFIVLSQMNALKFQLLSPEMEKIRTEMTAAYKSTDRNKISQSNKAMELLKLKYGINTAYNVIPLLQLPFVIYFFWTLQEMTYGIDKYPSMTTDGYLWFKNLTEADPYFLLPIGLAIASFLSIHKSPASSQMVGPAAKYVKYLKYLTFLGIPITSSFPAAIVLNWFIMSAFQLAINSVVYTKTGKRIIGIPQYLPGSMLEKANTTIKTPVIKPVVFSHKPNLTKTK